MKKIFHILVFGAAVLAALCCASKKEVEPGYVPGEYNHSLAVINENYSEQLVLNELSVPVTVTETKNLPYWFSVEAQEELNKNGHPVLIINVKKEEGMMEDRKIEGEVTLSTGDVLHLIVKQGADLPTGLNDGEILTSNNTALEADWASCKNISLVTSYVDLNGRTQVTTTEVALPWAEDALPQEWLPENDALAMVANKDQWELVFNLTGIESRPNYNYFGMYNKYSGLLRVFYYLDEAHIPPSDGNDHMWSMAFSENLAEYPVFQYGVPYNVSVSTPYKQAVGYPNIQYMTSATTSQMSQQGKVIPRIGWWACDVDMSQMRPQAMDSQSGYITPGMLLFSQDNVFLNSILNGDINGSINGNINLEALRPTGITGGGIFFEDLFTLTNSFLGSSGFGAIVSGTADKNDACGPSVGQGIAFSVLSLAMNITKQADGAGASETDKLGDISMNAKLNLTGEMVTQGTIGGERSTNIASPKISPEYFKTGTHFGQGVWN
ncbi:MAG: hypothetical protein IJ909_05085, partial [Fibrobacter sp.]|nr:hypothetical protein [Fibrobacter sp.]